MDPLGIFIVTQKKKQKVMVTYHKEHHTTSMKKHITFECANVWERWKTTWNLQVVTKVGGQGKSKKWPSHKFGAIINPFENDIIYNEEDAKWNKFVKDIVCCQRACVNFYC